MKRMTDQLQALMDKEKSGLMGELFLKNGGPLPKRMSNRRERRHLLDG